MNALADLAAYGHGVGGLGSTLAHAALWSMVGRFMWSAQPYVVVVLAAVAGIWVLFFGGMNGGRRGRD